MAVSGSPSAPIQIKSATVDNNVSGTAIIGGSGMTITGSYLHICRILAKNATEGFNINGAKHVSLDGCTAFIITNRGFWVHNNAQYIFLRNCKAGFSFTYIDNTTEKMTSGIKVGTPSASWSSGVPDSTNQVTLHNCLIEGVSGHLVELHEGAHHIKVMDTKASGGGAVPDPNNPPVWCSFDVSADDVTMQRNWSEQAVFYGLRMQSKVVGGVTYGKRNQLWRQAVTSPGGGNPNAGCFASNDPTHQLWKGAVNAPSRQSNPVFVDLAPTVTTWAQSRVDQPLKGTEDYKWGSPAEEYQYTYSEGLNEAGLHKYKYGSEPSFLTSEVGTAFTKLTDWACYGTAFYHTDEDHPIAVTKIGYFQAYPEMFGTFGAVFDMATRQMVPNSYTALKPETPNYYGWQHTTLPTTGDPALLWPYRMYMVAVWCPPGAYPISWSSNERTYLYTDGNLNKFITYPKASEMRPSYIYDANGYPYEVGSTVTSSMAATPPPYPPLPRIDSAGAVIWQAAPSNGTNYLVDVMIGYYRQPTVTVVSPTAPPAEGLQGKINAAIPGDTITISGLNKLRHTLIVNVSGTPNRPITIQGDGTTELRGAYDFDTAYVGVLVKGNYIKFQNMNITRFGRGLVLDGAHNVKVKNVTCSDIRGNGFTCENGCQYIYYDTCTAHDCGADLNTGNGFRLGSIPSAWGDDDTDISTDQPGPITPIYKTLINGDAVFPPPVHPDHVRYDNCQTYRTLGDGFLACSGVSYAVYKGCTADHSQGNAPVVNSGGGSACFHSRADKVQFINCTAKSAPQAGFQCFDVLWSSVTYGRGQQVKAGSATLPGQGGVVSQSDDMKVYSDFTSTGTKPRVVEIEGGWSASGSSVAPASFTELFWTAPAAIY